MLQRLLLITLTLCSLTASAQWQQTGSKVRYVNGLGIPTKDTAAGVSADSSQIVIRPADSALYIKYKRTWLRVGSGGTIGGSGTAGQVPFFTGATAISGDSAFFWDNINKRLGIHTINPGKNLDVHGTNVIAQFNGTGTHNAYLDFQRAGSTQWRIGNQYAAAANRFSIFNAAGTTENLTILQDGKVGVATPTPNTALQVGDGTGNPEITASGLNYDVVLGTPAGSALGFTTVGDYVGVYSNSATKDLAFTHGNGRAITFGTGNQTRLTITASGRLLANTRTDNGVDALQVAGSGRFTGGINVSGTGTFTGGISVPGTATFGIGSPTAIDGTDGRIITDKFRMYNSVPASQYHDFTSSATEDRFVIIPNVSGTMLFGTGTTNYVPKFTNANTVGNSLIYDDGINVGINTTSAVGRLTVKTGTNENVSILTLGSGDLRISALNDAASATVQLSIQGSPLLFRGSGGVEAMRITAGRVLINPSTDNGVDQLQVNGSVTATQFKLSALNTAPSSAGDTGTLGEIRIDANYIYICTATNTWKRVAIATW